MRMRASKAQQRVARYDASLAEREMIEEIDEAGKSEERRTAYFSISQNPRYRKKTG